MNQYEDVMLYKGKPIEEYSKEELIKIAREGWAAYHRVLEDSRRSMNLLNDLHKASRK